MDNTGKKNKWGTGVIQYSEDETVEVETGTDRIQLIQTKELSIANIYTPTDKGMTGVEEYEITMKMLDDILKENNGDREILVAGDLNWQPNHHSRRKEAVDALCKKFNLTWHTPKEPTFFGHRGERSTLDHALTSRGLSGVRYKVLTGDSVPGNLSTHAIVLWSFKLMTDVVPKKEEKESKKEKEINPLFKKFTRVNWEGGLDMDLYHLKVEAYLRIGLRASAGLNAAWRMSIAQDLMAEASEVARIKIMDNTDEEDTEIIKAVEKEISDLWREIKRRRCGYFSIGDRRHWPVRRLLAELPSQRKKVLEIRDLESELAGKKRQLSAEMSKIYNTEIVDENENLMIALAQAQSKDFHAGVKNTKVIKQDTPSAMIHNGRWFNGDEILSLYVLAAQEQSDEARNLPHVKFDKRHVFCKEIVEMKRVMAKYDKTEFRELNKVAFDKLSFSVKSNKSPDIFGVQTEHIRALPDAPKNLVRELFNEILHACLEQLPMKKKFLRQVFNIFLLYCIPIYSDNWF